MQIIPFAPEHLPGAGEISLTHWGDEVTELPEHLRPAVYQFLPRYYYMADSPFNLAAADENGRVAAFLLAAPVEMINSSVADNWLAENICRTDEMEIFAHYRSYLDGNRRAEENAALPGEVLLLLFASTQRGCGKMLMHELEARCKAHGITSILLWTDETCDFEYYFRNGFTEVANFPCPASLFGNTYMTWLFRKTV